jgi:hypothetical protein
MKSCARFLVIPKGFIVLGLLVQLLCLGDEVYGQGLTWESVLPDHLSVTGYDLVQIQALAKDPSDPNAEICYGYDDCNNFPLEFADMDERSGAFVWRPSIRDGVQAIWCGSIGIFAARCDDFSKSITKTISVDLTLGSLKGSWPDMVFPPTVYVGDHLELVLPEVDSSSPYPVEYFADNIPVGATFDPLSRKFDWTPDESQVDFDYFLIFRASDGHGNAYKESTISVVRRPPTAVAIFDFTAARKSEKAVEVSWRCGPQYDAIGYQIQRLNNGSWMNVGDFIPVSRDPSKVYSVIDESGSFASPVQYQVVSYDLKGNPKSEKRTNLIGVVSRISTENGGISVHLFGQARTKALVQCSDSLNGSWENIGSFDLDQSGRTWMSLSGADLAKSKMGFFRAKELP